MSAILMVLVVGCGFDLCLIMCDLYWHAVNSERIVYVSQGGGGDRMPEVKFLCAMVFPRIFKRHVCTLQKLVLE